MNLNYAFVKSILDAVFLTDKYISQLNKPNLLQATSQQNTLCETHTTLHIFLVADLGHKVSLDANAIILNILNKFKCVSVCANPENFLAFPFP